MAQTKLIDSDAVVMWTSDPECGWQSSHRSNGQDWKCQTNREYMPPVVKAEGSNALLVEHYYQDTFVNVKTGTVITKVKSYVQWEAKPNCCVDVCGYCGMVHDEEHPRNGYDCWNCGGN
jgi:hypothetical protein